MFQLTSWKTYNQSCSIYILLYLNIDKTGLKYTGFIISYCQAHTMRTQPLLFFYRKKRINDKEFTLLQYFWASTALAIFITMPMVASMLYFHFNYNNLLFGTLVGFSVHTAVLVFSKRLSSLLINLVSIWLALLTQGKDISFFLYWYSHKRNSRLHLSVERNINCSRKCFFETWLKGWKISLEVSINISKRWSYD